MKTNKEKTLNLIAPLISLFAILTLWAVMALKVDSEYILPTISQTAQEFIKLLKNRTFYTALSLTFLRSATAFLISFAVAFIFAVASHKIKYFKGFIFPIMSVLRALPTITIVLLLLFWTNSKVAPVVVTTLVVLPTLYTHILSALFSLDKTVAEAGRVDGADELNLFYRIELPQILPSVYSGIGSGLSLNIKLMVAAEVIAQTANSLGYILNTSSVYFEIAQMLAVVCFVVIMGVIIESAFNFLSKKSGEWKNEL